MQTALLTIWPLLNLVLFVYLMQRFSRRAFSTTYSRQTRLFSQLIVSIIVAITVRRANDEPDRQFVSRQPQPRRSVTETVSRHDVLLDSPTYSLKSHLTVSPDKEPTDSTKGTVMVTMVQAALHPMPGLRWEPQQTDVQVTPDGQLICNIQGELVWQLLTIPVFRQSETFTERSNL